MTLDAKKKEELEKKLRAYEGVLAGEEVGPYPVNETMIQRWCEVMGDRNPAYTDAQAAASSVHGGIVSPPMMLHPWVMPPGMPEWSLSREEIESKYGGAANKEIELRWLLIDYGYTSILGTNEDMEFHRYLRPGERITATKTIESISEEKATAVGTGYFVTAKRVFRNQDGEELGWASFRSFLFRPHQQPQAAESDSGAAASKPTRMRPPLGHDNSWWWEGIERDELPIQRCSSCGELRHPPRPMCGKCQSIEWDSVPARGPATVYSYTIMHHPKFPGFDYPFVAAVIELEEGTRIVSNVVGCDPGEVHIGMPVQLSIELVDGEMKLPVFRPVK